MNRESPPDYIEPSPEASVAATKDLISHIHSLPTSLVHPILTPRFAISCTSPLLSQLGTLASSNPNLAIQTHISENQSEIAFTKSLFQITNVTTSAPSALYPRRRSVRTVLKGHGDPGYFLGSSTSLANLLFPYLD